MVLLRQAGGEVAVPIEYRRGNLLHDDAEALVNTVNCIGVMGKGIALQFKQAYPKNYMAYVEACKRDAVRPGQMFIFDAGDMFAPRLIINFPTKRHWKARARLDDIAMGLKSLVDEAKRLQIKSIAIPPLGCGNGGLAWTKVKRLIEEAFSDVRDVSVRVYEPVGAPANEGMPVNTTRPAMTRAKAILLALMHSYSVAEYRLSLLEVQKLAYFLQVCGEPLMLNFEKGRYGPYAESLNHVLQRLEGHFIRGYGDRSREAQIKLLPEAKVEFESLLAIDEEARARLEQVNSVIWGFETPYGLELLATVHWCAQASVSERTPLAELVESIHSWNPRKHDMFSEEHISKAWSHLRKFPFLWSPA